MTREEAIKKLQRHKAEYLDEWVDFNGITEALDMAIKALEQEPKTGHWIVDLTGFSEMNGYILHCHCSNCRSSRTFYDSLSWSKPCIKNAETFNFCPNCGAKMSEIPTSSESEGKG